MPKLLQINATCTFGSTGMIASQIGNLARARGWDTYIAYGRNDHVSDAHTLQIGSIANLAEHFVETRLLDNHGFASRIATYRFLKKVERIRPDIVHLHNIHGYYINVQMLMEHLAKNDIPTVWTFHDCWAFTGHCAHYDAIGCTKWQDHCFECPQKKAYPTSFRDNSYNNYERKRRLFNLPRDLTIVPVSYWMGRQVRQSFLKDRKIKVIQNGIDLSVFHPMTSCSDANIKERVKGKFVILGVSSIWFHGDWKGYDDFLKLSEMIDDDTRIVMVGVNKKQLKELPDNIIGICRLANKEELAEIYSLADVFFNPTNSDNFPTTNLEVLACGTPVITYRTGGSVEAIDENTGIIVNKGDISGALKAINGIKNGTIAFSPDSCRQRAVKNFDKNERFLDYISLYEEILGNAPKRS